MVPDGVECEVTYIQVKIVVERRRTLPSQYGIRRDVTNYFHVTELYPNVDATSLTVGDFVPGCQDTVSGPNRNLDR